MTDEGGIVTSGAALERQDGRRIRTAGLYTAIAQPRKGPPDPAAPRDHAILTLDDGTEVFLEVLYGARARRPAEERAAFDGRRVALTGIAHKLMPADGGSLIAPCLSDIEDVREAE